MSLSVHRSERADTLVAGLARLLSLAPSDPFETDVVAVPSKGVERWIAQSLAAVLGTSDGGRDGVCANVAFPSPGRLVRDAVTAASGFDADADPWAERRLPWLLLDVIDDCGTQAWCVTLGRHLGLLDGDADRGRRMAVAQKLAGLYTSYGAQRPAMLRAWVAGHDTDGSGVALDSDHVWKAELWRRLRSSIGIESPAERMEPACVLLRSEPDLVDLPERFSIFGPTRLTTDQLRVIDSLAADRDVHLWLPHPSPGLWRRVDDGTDGAARLGMTRRDDPSADIAEHPLVRSLGRDARELQLSMISQLSVGTDQHEATDSTADSLLHVLQRDIHADAAPSASYPIRDDDTSVQIHACHGRQRQVEVLREVLLGMLADDPGLELRDIIVMCPDIEAYAPLITAAFGLSADDVSGAFATAHPGHRLTVRLADRSLRQTNPVLGVVARLLGLADARITASEVLDFAALPPVRRRFGFDDDGLEQIGDWTRSSGVRWGLDADAREPFGLSQVTQNTWQVGLDRLLVGVAMDTDDSRTFGETLPLDDVDSTEIDLAGRLAELVDRLAAAVASMRVQPMQAWVDALTQAVGSLVDVASADSWQLSQAGRLFSDALAAADDHAEGTMLSLADVRALLADRLRGRPTRANFRTGHLTMCTMVPMRSVPHRVVCLLGLDDGVFPRGARIDGDDILARRPWVGERDSRSEDRQLFLDAILAAAERLVILYSGADERTGAVRPPAVPLGELLDVLDETGSTALGRVRDRVVARHPLQPFDVRNFEPGRLVTGSDAFSFDTASFAGSRAVAAGQTVRPPFLRGPLPPEPGSGTVALDALVRFLEHPVKQFLRQRLGLGATDSDDEASEALPVTLDALERWSVGDRLLTAGLGGATRDQAVHAELLRGLLPPGQLGTAIVAPLIDDVTALIGSAAPLRSAAPEQLDVSVVLAPDSTLEGTVSSVYAGRVLRVVYSKLGAKHRLRAWVQLLALCAQWPERSWEAVTIGRGRGLTPVTTSRLAGVSGAQATAYLGDLLEVYRVGLTIPLPLPPKAACAYAEARRAKVAVARAESVAARAWRSGSGPNEMGEFSDADHQRVWGVVDLTTLLETPPDPADADWPDEPHRFGQLARAVWTPLLDAETIS